MEFMTYGPGDRTVRHWLLSHWVPKTYVLRVTRSSLAYPRDTYTYHLVLFAEVWSAFSINVSLVLLWQEYTVCHLRCWICRRPRHQAAATAAATVKAADVWVLNVQLLQVQIRPHHPTSPAPLPGTCHSMLPTHITPVHGPTPHSRLATRLSSVLRYVQLETC